MSHEFNPYIELNTLHPSALSERVEAGEGGPAALLYCPALASRYLTHRLPRDAGGVALQLGGEQFILRRPIQPIFGYSTLPLPSPLPFPLFLLLLPRFSSPLQPLCSPD